MSNEILAPRSFLKKMGPLAIVPFLSGCPSSNPGGGKKVVCHDAGNHEFCWKETFCGATEAQICAAGVYNDPTGGPWPNSVHFPGAKFEGVCNATTPEHPTPPCVCVYGTEDENICIAGSGGPPPEDEPTDGPESQQYICTIFSQEKCVESNWVEDPLLDPMKSCWVDFNQPDSYQPCVLATDAMDAKTQCEEKCSKHKMDIESNVSSWNMNNPTELIEILPPAIDCDLDDDPVGDEPQLLDSPYECAPENNGLKVWGGSTVLQPFSSTAGLVLTSGGTTSTSDIVGYIGFDVSNCGSGTCDVTIDALEVHKVDLAGIVWGFAGPLASYEVEGFDMGLIQVVHGTLYQSSGNITFPTEPFVGIVTADGYSIDSTPLGSFETTEYVTQITGSLDSSDVLTLNFTLNLDGGVFTMTVETYEP